jgi:hypothetical protein
VLTGCGHAGVVSIVRHAQRLTGVDRLHAPAAALPDAWVPSSSGSSHHLTAAA